MLPKRTYLHYSFDTMLQIGKACMYDNLVSSWVKIIKISFLPSNIIAPHFIPFRITLLVWTFVSPCHHSMGVYGCLDGAQFHVFCGAQLPHHKHISHHHLIELKGSATHSKRWGDGSFIHKVRRDTLCKCKHSWLITGTTFNLLLAACPTSLEWVAK